MSIWGNGVGGGLLATAGALGGLGQGVTQVGQEQTKENMETKMNALQQAREEAITRLQGSQQSQLEEQRAGHEEQRTHEEIAGRSGVAQFEAAHASEEAEKSRAFQGTQQVQKLGSEEKRTERTAESRENVAAIRTSASSSTGKGGKTWEVHNITEGGGYDPITHTPTPQTQKQILFNNKTGRQYVANGDRLLPYDASQGGTADPKSLKRAPATDVQALMQDPLGKVPDGYPNSGLDKATAFEQTHGYLPAQWMGAAQKADQQSSSNSTSLAIPGKWAPGMFKPGATATPGPTFGGGGGGNADQDGTDDQNADADAAEVGKD